MKILREKIFEGKNIYSMKKIIRIDIDFEGYSQTLTKDVLYFSSKLFSVIEQITKHKEDIDYNDIFLMDLKDTYNYIISLLEDRLNLNMKFRDFKKISKEVYCVIIEYEYENLTLEVYKLAMNLINSLIKNEEIDIENRLREIKKLKRVIEPNAKLIIDKAIQKNIPVIKLSENCFYQIGYGKNGRILNGNLVEKIKGVSLDLLCDKLLISDILKSHYIPIVSRKKIKSINKFLDLSNEINYPMVLKNQYEGRKNSTISNIKDYRSLLKAYKTLSEEYDDLILEKYIEGKNFRVCIVDYKVVAVALRIRPFVIGDGKKNLKELIRDLNKDEKRVEDNSKLFNKIKIDEDLLSCIEKQGLIISSIPVKQERVYLRENANLLLGGVSEDYTEFLSEENKKICEKVSKILELDVCGVDIITEDITKSLNKTGAIIDITARPNIVMHEFPYKGKGREVSSAILNMMYENYIENIPVLSVLGNHETIVSGMNYILSRMGYLVGAKTENHILINNCYINRDNNQKDINAKTIFLNKEVDIGILGMTEQEIIDKGLDYDLCDVAIMNECNILNKNQNLNDFDLAEMSVLKSIKSEGYVVVNVDKLNSTERLNQIRAKKIFISRYNENEILQQNIDLGDPVVYIDNEIMYVENNKKKYMICKIKDIPIINYGDFEEGIQNAMAICAGLIGLKVDYCMIAKGLKNLGNILTGF